MIHTLTWSYGKHVSDGSAHLRVEHSDGRKISVAICEPGIHGPIRFQLNNKEGLHTGVAGFAFDQVWEILSKFAHDVKSEGVIKGEG